MMRVGNSLLAVLLALVMAGCSVEIQETASSEAVYLDNIPAFSGEPYVVIHVHRGQPSGFRGIGVYRQFL